MKTKNIPLWLPLFICAIVWGVTPVEAAQKKNPPDKKQQAANNKKPAKKVGGWKNMPMTRSKEYKRFDTNNDGTLDAAEIERIKKTFRTNPNDAYLMPYDRDDDKQLSDKEIKAIPPKEVDQDALQKNAKGKK